MRETTKPEAEERHLDRGWSWVVLAAVFVSFFVMQGQLLTGNIYFIIYLREFGQPRSITAFTGAAYTAVVNLAGPLASVLLRKFGPRFLLMSGGCIMSGGFLCIYPARNIGEVIFASGVIRGIGGSFIMTGCQASLSRYFSKRLYVATGVMYSASAMGMMTIGLMTEYVIAAYGWRGSLIIQAGLTLHVCLCGALVFKVPKRQRSPQRSLLLHEEEEEERGPKRDGEEDLTPETEKDGAALSGNPLPETAGEDAGSDAIRQTPEETKSNGDGAATSGNRLPETAGEDTGSDANNQTPEETKSNGDGAAISGNRLPEAAGEDAGSDAINRQTPEETESNGDATAEDRTTEATSGSGMPEDRKTGSARPSPRQYMRDVRFWCISGCTTMLFMFTSVVVIFWKDILPRKEHFKAAVVAMAAGSTLGRATAGLVSGRVAPPLHNCAVATGNALVILGFLLSDRVWVVAAHNFAWGFLNGQQTVADRLQLAWVFGRLDMPVVLGYSLVFVGVGGFVAPPLAGFITDVTGNYLGTLLMTSAFSLLGASLSLVLYFVHKSRLRRASEESRNGVGQAEAQSRVLIKNGK